MSQDTNTVELDIGDAEETEVDVVESNDAGDLATSSSEETSENFERAETATQKRIDRLTKKMREAERREQEAVRYAHAVQNEATQLKSQVDALDTNYVSEYSNRVMSEMERVEEQLARSIELGDSAGTVESQRKLTSLAIQADRAAQAKLQQENSRNQAFAAQQQQQYQQQQQPQKPANPVKRPDARAEQWALRNSWFGQDEAMTYAAFGIHKALVENEGFDPSGSEYYNELDRRIAGKFGGGAKTSSKRPAQTVAGASRTSNGRTGRKVRLTPSQVAIAKKLGVPLEEYAKYVKD
tara:strand:+ start:289 stop:1176 length:888 start_codon:yes stop_codon:yes gene_type:complete